MLFALFTAVCFSAGLTVILWVTLAELERRHPDPLAWPVARLLLWPAAHVLVLLRRLGGWLMAMTVAQYMKAGRRQRVYDWLFRLGDRMEALPTRWHYTARVLGLVCDRHYDEAPDWWDWDVDCGGHDCRICFTCEPSLIDPLSPLPFNVADDRR